jgi:hypothetical protein
MKEKTRVLPWTTIAYGAALSAVAADILIALAVRPRRAAVIITAALAAAIGPAIWNAILTAVQAPGFFTDAPVAIMPASWQDTGSGVFAIATAALALGLGPLARETGRRTSTAALLTGVAAFLVDVYLY